MPKIKQDKGFRFVKELGGAIKRKTVSITAQTLVDRELVVGRILDYGCGFGFDADHFEWESYDPHYKQVEPDGTFDTIICNHVANMLTQKSRCKMFEKINSLLNEGGKAYISVSRNIPKRGKAGIRKRIQNHVVLTLPSIYIDKDLEIYQLDKDTEYQDKTTEFV